MDFTISIAEIKSKFSEYISKAAYSNERYIITKRDKPIAALVNIDDLTKLKAYDEKEGLYTALSKWENFEEIESFVQESYESRQNEQGRKVSF